MQSSFNSSDLCVWALYLSILEEKIMDKDRIIGTAKVVKGEAKQKVGKALGDTKLQSQGTVDKIEGKIQNAIGGLKDTLKGK